MKNKVLYAAISVALMSPLTANAVNILIPNDAKQSTYAVNLVSHVGKTWTYSVSQVQGRTLSHWVLGINNCLNNVTSSSPSHDQLGADPSTDAKFVGIKWNSAGGTFSFTLDKEYAETTLQAFVKTATVYNTGNVTGPDCSKPITSTTEAAATQTEAEKAEADKEAADKAKADKEKSDKEAADNAKADKEKSDKEAADNAKADKEKSDKEAADNAKADKEKSDKEAADNAKADKEKSDKEAADKAKADKEKSDKEAADNAKADKEKSDKEAADKAKADKEAADKAKADKEKSDKEAADKAKADKEKSDKEAADKAKADKEKSDKEAADKAKADKEKSDKEAADKAKADKEKSDKEAADKAKADKEKSDKEAVGKTTNTLCASSANMDSYAFSNSQGHSAWIPGIATDLVFADDAPGQFVENADGTAKFTGNVARRGDAKQGFSLDVSLTGAQATAPGEPKKELNAKAYNEGKADMSKWYFYTGFEGTLTGTGNFEGGKIHIVRMGPAFQIGNGANGKNIHFGASGWFSYDIVSQPSNSKYVFYKTKEHADFNVDLSPCAEKGTTTSPASSVDSEGKSKHSNASFGLRVTTPRASGNDLEVEQNDDISVDASIIADAEHVGKTADVIVVGIYNNVAFVRDGDEWKEWDGKVEHLTAAKKGVTLSSSPLPANVLKGSMKGMHGSCQVRVGYRVDGKLIYNDEALKFTVK